MICIFNYLCLSNKKIPDFLGIFSCFIKNFLRFEAASAYHILMRFAKIFILAGGYMGIVKYS